MANPAIAPLLIKSYLEDNFGIVEKIVIQGKFAFAIFDRDETAHAVVRKGEKIIFEFYSEKINKKVEIKNNSQKREKSRLWRDKNVRQTSKNAKINGANEN